MSRSGREHQRYHRRAPHRPQHPAAAPRKVVTSEQRRSARDAIVTDHAVLRWVERVVGIDLARQVRQDMLGDGRAAKIAAIGDGTLRVASLGVDLVIRGGLVVTVVAKDMRA